MFDVGFPQYLLGVDRWRVKLDASVGESHPPTLPRVSHMDLLRPYRLQTGCRPSMRWPRTQASYT
eukprot:9425357-Alexandrium_andersonii.AAC.1